MEHPSRTRGFSVRASGNPKVGFAYVPWCLTVLALRWLVPGLAEHNGVFVAFALASAVGVALFVAWAGRSRKALLELTPASVTLGQRSLRRDQLEAEFQTWKDPYVHSTQGTAVCLRDGHGVLRLGGRQRLAIPAHDSSLESVDASLSAEDFDALLSALSLDERSRPAGARDAIVIDLVSSTLSLRGFLRVSATWLKTLAVAGALGLLSGVLHVEQHPALLYPLEGLTLLIVVVGLVLSYRNNQKIPVARYRLLVEPGRVMLEDRGARFDRSLVIGPPQRVERRFYRMSGRSGRTEYGVVRVFWPGGRQDNIGVAGPEFRWRNVPRSFRIGYLIGSEEWRRLTSALRLR